MTTRAYCYRLIGTNDRSVKTLGMEAQLTVEVFCSGGCTGLLCSYCKIFLEGHWRVVDPMGKTTPPLSTVVGTTHMYLKEIV